MRLLRELEAARREYGVAKTAQLAGKEAKRIVLNQTLRRSYSQAYEDRFAYQLIGRRRTGFYVDVGCHDPVRLSNTYLLYRKGWSGLAVDAARDHAARFAKVRPRDTFVQVGVGRETVGPQPFYVHAASALSTFSRAQSDRYVAEGHPLLGVHEVPIMSLADVLAAYAGDHHVDFLNLDIEGLDFVALESNDWARYRPDVICIEVAASGDDSSRATIVSPEIDDLLRNHGYSLAGLRGVNAFYCPAS
jgi:hypothetical protein